MATNAKRMRSLMAAARKRGKETLNDKAFSPSLFLSFPVAWLIQSDHRAFMKVPKQSSTALLKDVRKLSFKDLSLFF